MKINCGRWCSRNRVVLDYYRGSPHPLSSGRSINLSFSLQIVGKYFDAVETQKFVCLLPSNPLPLTCMTQVRAVLGVSERG